MLKFPLGVGFLRINVKIALMQCFHLNVTEHLLTLNLDFSLEITWVTY